MTVDEYRELNPEAFEPRWMGAKADQGKLVVGDIFPDEGFATIRCGNTEVRVSYTVLHNVVGMIQLDPQSAMYRDQASFRDAMRAITCEASLGRTGDV